MKCIGHGTLFLKKIFLTKTYVFSLLCNYSLTNVQFIISLKTLSFLLDGDDKFTLQIFLDVEGNFSLPKGRNFLFKEFPQVWMSVLTSILQTAALMKLWRKFYKESYTHRSQLIAHIIKQRTMWKFLFMQEIQKENYNLI